MEGIIKQLDQKEFELLADLIFRQAGWQRISQLGKTWKTLDLDLVSRIAHKRYLVQAKSQANLKLFEQFQADTGGMEEYREYYPSHLKGNEPLHYYEDYCNRFLELYGDAKAARDARTGISSEVNVRSLDYFLYYWGQKQKAKARQG